MNCRVADRPDWPKGMVKWCEYTVTDTVNRGRAPKFYTAAVWLADPSPARVAEWAWSACRRAKPADLTGCSQVVIGHIVVQSSAAHFPGAGLYYEDICSRRRGRTRVCAGDGDGRHEAWMFRDGVTSRLSGFDGVNGTMWPSTGGDVFATSDATATATLAGIATGKVRPVSLLPSQYKEVAQLYNLDVDVTKPGAASAWLEVIRDAYIPALSGPDDGSENPLVGLVSAAELATPLRVQTEPAPILDGVFSRHVRNPLANPCTTGTLQPGRGRHAGSALG